MSRVPCSAHAWMSQIFWLAAIPLPLEWKGPNFLLFLTLGPSYLILCVPVDWNVLFIAGKKFRPSQNQTFNYLKMSTLWTRWWKIIDDRDIHFKCTWNLKTLYILLHFQYFSGFQSMYTFTPNFNMVLKSRWMLGTPVPSVLQTDFWCTFSWLLVLYLLTCED